jgi:hypothetical protein
MKPAKQLSDWARMLVSKLRRSTREQQSFRCVHLVSHFASSPVNALCWVSLLIAVRQLGEDSSAELCTTVGGSHVQTGCVGTPRCIQLHAHCLTVGVQFSFSFLIMRNQHFVECLFNHALF